MVLNLITAEIYSKPESATEVLTATVIRGCRWRPWHQTLFQAAYEAAVFTDIAHDYVSSFTALFLNLEVVRAHKGFTVKCQNVGFN